MSREDFDRAGGLRRQQHITRQVEQARHLVAARDRLASALLRRRRQIARNDSNDQERKQRDPVLRIDDGERADRREKEEVQREHGRDRHDDGHPETREGGGPEHDEQKRKGNRCRTDVRQCAEDYRENGNGEESPEESEDISNRNRSKRRHRWLEVNSAIGRRLAWVPHAAVSGDALDEPDMSAGSRHILMKTGSSLLDGAKRA